MENMWEDFTDFELCELAFDYHLQDKLEINFDDRFRLINREEIERLLTAAEYESVYADELFEENI